MAQPKALELLQKRVLNILFPVAEYTTYLIIASVEKLTEEKNDMDGISS